MNTHHTIVVRVAPGVTEIARPLRASGFFLRRRLERNCGKTLGHCWHPDGMIDWWCCNCSGDEDGMPPQRCRICTEATT